MELLREKVDLWKKASRLYHHSFVFLGKRHLAVPLTFCLHLDCCYKKIQIRHFSLPWEICSFHAWLLQCKWRAEGTLANFVKLIPKWGIWRQNAPLLAHEEVMHKIKENCTQMTFQVLTGLILQRSVNFREEVEPTPSSQAWAVARGLWRYYHQVLIE